MPADLADLFNPMMSENQQARIAHEKKIASKTNEILDILQEECAEVIQEISKCRRFGMDNQYNGDKTQREKLVQEIGDVELLIELLHAYQLFTKTELHEAKNQKSQKLDKYSTIYER